MIVISETHISQICKDVKAINHSNKFQRLIPFLREILVGIMIEKHHKTNGAIYFNTREKILHF